ncbi:hypothetical protein TNCV_2964861 [Trichonephila clavipes]|nr:hypothetical protein TNCV_2964861 [Trichonephila clavipes]
MKIVRASNTFWVFWYAKQSTLTPTHYGHGSRVVKVLDRDQITSSSPVPLKTRRVGKQCTLNLSGVQTSFRWCGVVVLERWSSSDVIHVT